MKRTILATLIALSTTTAIAGPGGMATNTELSHEATARRAADVVLNDKIKGNTTQIGKLWDRTVELNTYTNGNSVAIKSLAAKTDATNADVTKANGRIDAVAAQGNQTATRVTNVERTTAQHGATLADHETRISSNTSRVETVERTTTKHTSQIQQLGARADDTDLALIGVQQTNQRQDVRLSGHDAALAQQDQINEALSTSVAGLYTDMSGLRGEVRQARREAKQARAGAAAALAVAGHQFDTKGGFQTAISVANMGGYSALAIGAGGAISDRVFINAGLTTSSNQTGAVLSGTYSW